MKVTHNFAASDIFSRGSGQNGTKFQMEPLVVKGPYGHGHQNSRFLHVI